MSKLLLQVLPPLRHIAVGLLERSCFYIRPLATTLPTIPLSHHHSVNPADLRGDSSVLVLACQPELVREREATLPRWVGWVLACAHVVHPESRANLVQVVHCCNVGLLLLLRCRISSCSPIHVVHQFILVLVQLIKVAPSLILGLVDLLLEGVELLRNNLHVVAKVLEQRDRAILLLLLRLLQHRVEDVHHDVLQHRGHRQGHEHLAGHARLLHQLANRDCLHTVLRPLHQRILDALPHIQLHVGRALLNEVVFLPFRNSIQRATSNHLVHTNLSIPLQVTGGVGRLVDQLRLLEPRVTLARQLDVMKNGGLLRIVLGEGLHDPALLCPPLDLLQSLLHLAISTQQGRALISLEGDLNPLQQLLAVRAEELEIRVLLLAQEAFHQSPLLDVHGAHEQRQPGDPVLSPNGSCCDLSQSSFGIAPFPNYSLRQQYWQGLRYERF